MGYREYWDQIYEKSDELNSLVLSYWDKYSNLGTWQFWVVAFLLIFPLIILYFKVDRKRIFEWLFFGYTVHILWNYTAIVLEKYGYFVHTYFLLPVLPMAVNVTASALPVGFLLMYQYCSNNKKNFFLYTVLLSAVFAFGLVTIEDNLGIVEINKGMNQIYIFLIDIAIAFVSLWLTKLIKGMAKVAEK
ncbi:hypothetical protein [Oceanobacillus senegalensis]|uniref:hypothetical protein n=1 Tax=Oceanobacillus senegalensis TaxID=1936063 RepID=UPI000A30B5BB|nr:hypothetical protein [Oceanobacillus senegalensis]